MTNDAEIKDDELSGGVEDNEHFDELDKIKNEHEEDDPEYIKAREDIMKEWDEHMSDFVPEDML